MALFSWFRKQQPAPAPLAPVPGPPVSLAQLCYDIAYFILPHYAFHDLKKIVDLCLHSPEAAGPYWYAMALVRRGMEPNVEYAKQFSWQHGQLAAELEYFILQYPVPPPIDVPEEQVKQAIAAGEFRWVLAPYFSGVARKSSGEFVGYFVLGQAPMGGGTTLRQIVPEGSATKPAKPIASVPMKGFGMNYNLGPGPKPELSLFLGAVREQLSASV